MTTNLQLNSNMSSTPQYVQDAAGPTNSSLAISTDKVGIGTTNAGEKLHVLKSTSNYTYSDILRLEGTAGGAGHGVGILFHSNGGSAKLARIKGVDADNWDGKLVFDVSNATGSGQDSMVTAMTILGPSGNVGIGTTNPGVKLDVSTASNEAIMLLCNALNTGSAATSTIRAGAAGRCVDLHAYSADYSGTAMGGSISLAGWTRLSMHVGNGLLIDTEDQPYPIVFGTNNAERMRITSGGDVGIGVTAPSEKFEVNGGVKIGDSSNTNAGTLRFHSGALQVYQSGAWKTVTVS